MHELPDLSKLSVAEKDALTLTPAGRRSFAKMAARHEEWVAGMMDGLTEAERHTLHALLGHLKTAVSTVRRAA